MTLKRVFGILILVLIVLMPVSVQGIHAQDAPDGESTPEEAFRELPPDDEPLPPPPEVPPDPPSSDVIQVDIHQVEDTSYPQLKVYFSSYNTQTGRVIRPQLDAISATIDRQAITRQALDDISDIDRPVQLMFVFDLTSSVAANYLDQQKATAQTIMDGLDPNDQVGGVSFDSFEAKVVKTPNSDHNDMRNQIDMLSIVQGPSNRFLDGVYLALETLQSVAAPDARQMVIVLTDVVDPKGDRTRDEIVQLAQQLNTPIHLIGLGNEVSETVLRDFSSATRGFTYLERKQDGGDLNRLARDVADVVATEYVARFMSAVATDNGARATLVFRIDSNTIGGQAQADIIKSPQTLLVSLPNLQNDQTVSGTVVFEPSITYAPPADGVTPQLAKVDYYIQDEFFREGTPNMEWNTTDKPGGEYTVRVDVRDAVGNVGSTSVMLRISTSITVQITSPEQTDTATPPKFKPGTVVIEATILSDVSVSEAFLFVNDAQIGGPVSTEGTTYRFEWDASESKWAGEVHTVEIRASDLNGAQAFDRMEIRITLSTIDMTTLIVLIGAAVAAVVALLWVIVRRRRIASTAAAGVEGGLFPSPSSSPAPGGSAFPNPMTEIAFHAGAGAAPTPRAGARLVGLQPASVSGRDFYLTLPMTALGRSKRENHLQFDDKTMSRHHAQIYEQGGQFYYRDLNAPNYNPSYINDQLVQGDTMLRSGDRIRAGDTTLEFRVR